MTKKYSVTFSTGLRAIAEDGVGQHSAEIINQTLCEIQGLIPFILSYSQALKKGWSISHNPGRIWHRAVVKVLASPGIHIKFKGVNRMVVFLDYMGHARYLGGFMLEAKLLGKVAKNNVGVRVFFDSNGIFVRCEPATHLIGEAADGEWEN